MSRRKLHIGVLTACVVLLLGLVIAHLREHPPDFYYTQFYGLHELPTRLIRTTFSRITGHRKLPKKADGLRAIYYSTNEPAIFVKFQTDSEGIEYILNIFGGPAAKSEMFDADYLKALTAANVTLFSYPSRWQKELGIFLYDQDSIESGRLLTGWVDSEGLDRYDRYTIFIDDQRNTVYIMITTE